MANGDYVLFARLQQDQAQLWLMRADGSGLKAGGGQIEPGRARYFPQNAIEAAFELLGEVPPIFALNLCRIVVRLGYAGDW